MGKLSQTAGLFRLLGDEKRLRLLKLLQSGQAYCSELSLPVGLSSSTTHRHLRALAAAGFAKARETRYLVYYSLAPRDTPGGRLARLACSLVEGDRTATRDLRILRDSRPRKRRRISR
jgi:DNA-binding transcriptional ArsR family regulator